MRYQDRKYGYSLEIPDEWKGQRRKLWFLVTGGKIAFESPDGEANINVSVGQLDKKEWTDKFTRRMAMADFLRTAPPSFEMSDYVEEVKDFSLDSEENTVYYRHAVINGYGRIISSVHAGVEYVIQSKDSRRNSYEATIDKIIGSFKFKIA